MFIAFEGPDQTGKSTSAKNLDFIQKPDYNATKEMHAHNVRAMQGAAYRTEDSEPDVVHTYDRIDWFSHMVYRLALPDKEWNDERPRTVFAMPDTHLVVKLHRPDLADFLAPEEVVETPIAEVNPMYYYFADFLTGLNEERDFALFKTISIVEVANDPKAGTFSQKLASFSSASLPWEFAEKLDVSNDEMLLELLRYDEQQSL